MTDSWDHDLRGSAEEPPEQTSPSRQTGLWIVGALFLGATIFAVYVAFFGGGQSAPETPAATVATPPVPEAKEQRAGPLGGQPLPVTVPPLDETDPLVRRLVRDLSSHPQVAAWLATDYRIRNFTVVVTNIAEGKTPSGLVPELRPRSGFRMIGRRGFDRSSGQCAALRNTQAAHRGSTSRAGISRRVFRQHVGTCDRPAAQDTRAGRHFGRRA
jgi:hypothetical protein